MSAIDRRDGIGGAEKKKFSLSALENKLMEKKPSDVQKSMRKFLLFILVLSIFCLPGSAGTFSGKCVGISDGDTISVFKSGRAVKIRLEGIDCPELGQDFGTRARRFTSDMVFGKIVEVKEYNQDDYGRTVARVYINGQDLCQELVKAGLAWYFRKHSSDPILRRAEDQARKQKIGLWSMQNPIPPWEYRRRQGRRLGQGTGGRSRALLVQEYTILSSAQPLALLGNPTPETGSPRKG